MKFFILFYFFNIDLGQKARCSAKGTWTILPCRQNSDLGKEGRSKTYVEGLATLGVLSSRGWPSARGKRQVSHVSGESMSQRLFQSGILFQPCCPSVFWERKVARFQVRKPDEVIH